MCDWLTEIDDTDDDDGDCIPCDVGVGPSDVDDVSIDDDVGTTGVCVELICHNGVSGFWKLFLTKFLFLN